MNAGEMDRLVSIERPVAAKDPATGAAVTTWVTFCQAWAKVVESAITPRDEKLLGDVHVYGRPGAFTLYWVDGIDTTMRVNDNGALYQIHGTAMVGRRNGIALHCTAFSTD